MGIRRRMDVGDWLRAGFYVLIGPLLGVALNGVVELVADGARPLPQ